MLCGTEAEVELVQLQKRAEEMGYDGFAVVKGMACLKQDLGQLDPAVLEPIKRKCTFRLYSPAQRCADSPPEQREPAPHGRGIVQCCIASGQS
mmetsp:Transcript_93474/g.237955  ORF Transcript_93474/g.237955 Transcript_93474/m.237955 type:complete len:93 (+) Transcript_93474:389-667(+)